MIDYHYGVERCTCMLFIYVALYISVEKVRKVSMVKKKKYGKDDFYFIKT